MGQEQWPKIEFTLPSSSPSAKNLNTCAEIPFLNSTERLKAMFSSAQRQVFLLTASTRMNSAKKSPLTSSSSEPAQCGPQCMQLKRNAQASMNARLGGVGTRFRAFQMAYVAQMERNVKFTAQRISKAPTSAQGPRPDMQGALDGGGDMSSLQYQQQHHLLVMDVDSKLRAQRDQEIFRIASAVLDLKSILAQMRQLTLEQGSMIDRIDVHVQESAQFVARARGRVRDRAGEQEDFFVRKCVLLGLLSAILLLFLYLLQR